MNITPVYVVVKGCLLLYRLGNLIFGNPYSPTREMSITSMRNFDVVVLDPEDKKKRRDSFDFPNLTLYLDDRREKRLDGCVPCE